MTRVNSLRFPGGRVLAFTDIGDPDGPVVFYNHGAPGSRLELVGLHGAFSDVGVRLIAADRPGYGGSTVAEGRTTADWADDIAALADHLGVERFVVAGLSSGGPYTVACAAVLRERVAGAVVAAGNTDMSWPGASDGYLRSELDIMALADAAAAEAYCVDHLGADGSGFFEGPMDLGPTDSAWLADDANGAALGATMGEAFDQGVVGYAHDIWVQGRAWSFDPSTITCPVIVVHGADDRLVPIAHSEHTAGLIPGAEFRILEGVGHLSLVDGLPLLAAEVIGLLG